MASGRLGIPNRLGSVRICGQSVHSPPEKYPEFKGADYNEPVGVNGNRLQVSPPFTVRYSPPPFVPA